MINTPENQLSNKANHLDVRSKSSLLILALLVSFLFNDPFVHLVLFFMIVTLGVLKKYPLSRLFSSIIPLLPILFMVVLFIGFSNPDQFLDSDNKFVLWRLGDSLTLTIGGLKMGVTILCRLINMVAMTVLLLSTTDIDDFIQLFHKLRLPNTIAFILTTAIRFIPELEKKRKLIMDAQVSRGVDLESAGFLKRYYLQISTMLPLIINAIIMADKLTIALLSRGFGYKTNWTNLQEIRLSLKDLGIILICLSLGFFCMLIRIKTDCGRL